MAARHNMNRVRVLPLEARKAMTTAQRDRYNEARFDAYMLATMRGDLVAAVGTLQALERPALAARLSDIIIALDLDEELARF